nr:IS110 family transposase [Streptomyces sp. RLB1-33]
MTSTSPAPHTRRRRLAGEVVLGVDTHRDAHVAAVLSLVGAVIGTEVFPATVAGYRELLAWARGLGTVRGAGVEGTGSFGAALSRYLLTEGVEVFDVNRPDRTDRRVRGKSDPRCPERGPGGAERAGACPGHVRRWTGADRPDVQTCQGLGSQGPHPDDQPAQGRPRQWRPEPAGRTGRAEQFRTLLYLRAARRRQQERRGRRRDGAAGHPHHPVFAGPPNRAAHRADPGLGRPPGPARGTPRPAAAHRGGRRSGHGRRFADHDGGQPGTPGQ